jgi:hypothetical protein
MSYTGIRSPYFSNTDETYMGQPTGTATANNAQVFRNTKHIVAFYSDILNSLPDKPINIVVSTPTYNGATVSWDVCKNAASYRVYTAAATSSPYWSTSNTYYTLNSSTRFDTCNTYKIWVAALNECGDISRSDTITFTTKCPTDPTVATLPAADTTHNSATLHKTVTANGDAVISEGFYYKETTADTWQPSANGLLTGLTPNTQYKFYAYATTAKGTYNGKVLTFETVTDVGYPIFAGAGLENLLQVFPNPAVGQLHVMSYALHSADYTIYSVVGQTVLQGKLSCENTLQCVSTLNVEPLAKGMYFLKIAEKTARFVKE